MATIKNIKKRARALIEAHERKKAQNIYTIHHESEPLEDQPDNSLVVTLTSPQNTAEEPKLRISTG